MRAIAPMSRRQTGARHRRSMLTGASLVLAFLLGPLLGLQPTPARADGWVIECVDRPKSFGESLLVIFLPPENEDSGQLPVICQRANWLRCPLTDQWQVQCPGGEVGVLQVAYFAA